MADEKKDAGSDDKSINELLKEYAEDVKDKDFDDFLKAGDDEDEEDAFEGEDAEDEADAALAAAGEPKKSGGGFATMLFIVIVFGAAGAGAWYYLNRSDGMTSIMGGFSSAPEPDLLALDTPPAPEAMPVLPDAPAQPMPIVNETSSVTSEPVPAVMPAPGADLLAMPEPEPATPGPAAPAVPSAPETQAADASQAVNAWVGGLEPAPPASEPATPLPETSVSEVKAKPPVTAAPKKEPAAEPVAKKSEEPAKKKAAASPLDDALPPPYVAIQAKKGGTVADAPAPAKSRMAPVVEGGVKHSASGTGVDMEGKTNKNVSDVTSATGETAAMVAQGGGKIELGTTLVPAPVGMMPRSAPQPAPARTTSLAIQGAKSVPPGTVVQSRTQVQLPPAGDTPRAPESEPSPPAVPVEAVEQVRATPPAQPVSLSSGEQDANAILEAAMAAEKSGDTGEALELYQRALEADAVYADGKSIDRGMVYDRIGAIRAGSR